jgi:hypothetical protein
VVTGGYEKIGFRRTDGCGDDGCGDGVIANLIWWLSRPSLGFRERYPQLPPDIRPGACAVIRSPSLTRFVPGALWQKRSSRTRGKTRPVPWALILPHKSGLQPSDGYAYKKPRPLAWAGMAPHLRCCLVGGCGDRMEKIGFGARMICSSKKNQARMSSKRLLRLGCTFRIKH